MKLLSAPPLTVKILDAEHQEFLGLVYRKYKGRYRRNGKKLHREVWKAFNGEIPAGYDIHHIDLNLDNNDISNLQCLPKSVHRELHAKLRTGQPHNKVIKEIFQCEVCGKQYEAFNTSRNRFCSTACQNKYFRKVLKKKCAWCGKEFETTNSRTKFCSKKCAAFFAGRRLKKICPICGKEFETQASVHSKTCSRECSYKLQSRARQSSLNI